MTVFYEWCVEEVDKYGDVVDHDFADKLDGSCFEDYDIGGLVPEGERGFELCLVREDDGDRVWAYAHWEDGKLVLAECWNNGIRDKGDMPNWNVPVKFHRELARWQRAWL